MGDISAIPTTEMIEDYYASIMDRDTCKNLLAIAEIALRGAEVDGVSLPHAQKTVARLQERVSGNQRIMNIIRIELQRRNELPDSLPL